MENFPNCGTGKWIPETGELRRWLECVCQRNREGSSAGKDLFEIFGDHLSLWLTHPTRTDAEWVLWVCELSGISRRHKVLGNSGFLTSQGGGAHWTEEAFSGDLRKAVS